MNFLQALLSGAYPFLINAFLAGLLASVLFGTLGTIITVKRLASLAGAISHAVLGGIGLALFLASRGVLTRMPPVLGALVFALGAAIIIGLVSLKAKQREDTVINAIWATGMSLGILFMAKTPGYLDPMSYLFGNILLVSRTDIFLLAFLDIVIVSLIWLFYPQIQASSFDEEFAQVRSVPVDLIFFVTLAVTAVAVVLLQTFVGIVMVIAMLTIPAGTAGAVAKSLAQMMILAVVLALFFTTGGLAISWEYDLPSGAVVVVFAGTVFLATSAIKSMKRQRRAK